MPNLDKIKIDIQNIINAATTKNIQAVILLSFLEEAVKDNICLLLKEIKQKYYEKINNLLLDKDFLQIGLGGKFHRAYIDRLTYDRRESGDSYVIEKVNSEKGDKYKLTADILDNKQQLIHFITSSLKEKIDKDHGKFNQLVRNLDISIPYIYKLKANVLPKNLFNKILVQVNDFGGIYNFLTNYEFLNDSRGYEMINYAILKVFLSKLGCKLYRDTITLSKDKGVDVSTNFGVQYQIKKKKITTTDEFKKFIDELENNFTSERITEGNLIIIVEEIKEEFM